MPKAKVIFSSRRAAKRKNRHLATAGRAAASPPEIILVPDYGTAERWQHSTRTFYIDADSSSLAARALEECVLDTLRVTGIISPALYTAGMKLRRDYTRAALAARQVGKYGGTGEKLQYREFMRSATEEEAYQEWRAALLAAGVQYGDVLVNVCCIGWAPVSADTPRLKDGLERLYDHYQRLKPA